MNPYADNRADAVSSLGESELIQRIKRRLGDANPPSPAGIGDDCAVFAPPAGNCLQLVTADPVVYGKHFNASLSPEQVAAKLARRNLSDIAAMGGRPRLATVSLALDPDVSIAWMERFYAALADEARSYAFDLVGGDLSSADNFLGAFLTLIGETLPDTPALLRQRSRDRSPILVTGTLGGSLLRKHHAFTPRLDEGQWLARHGDCLSCTDLSDGLGKDLSNLLPVSLLAKIDCAQIPLSDDARKTAAASGKSSLYHAFNDGEDYELLFSLTPDADLASFHQAWSGAFSTPLAHIGYATTRASEQEPAIHLLNPPSDLAPTGYEHLR